MRSNATSPIDKERVGLSCNKELHGLFCNEERRGLSHNNEECHGLSCNDEELPAAILGRIDVVVTGGRNGANIVLAVRDDANEETATRRSGGATQQRAGWRGGGPGGPLFQGQGCCGTPAAKWGSRAPRSRRPGAR